MKKADILHIAVWMAQMNNCSTFILTGFDYCWEGCGGGENVYFVIFTMCPCSMDFIDDATFLFWNELMSGYVCFQMGSGNVSDLAGVGLQHKLYLESKRTMAETHSHWLPGIIPFILKPHTLIFKLWLLWLPCNTLDGKLPFTTDITLPCSIAKGFFLSTIFYHVKCWEED